MTREEAIKYCYENEDNYIRGAESCAAGRREFDCLIGCLESGHIKPEDLADYGMDYEMTDYNAKKGQL